MAQHRGSPPPPHFEGPSSLDIYARSQRRKRLTRDERAWLESLAPRQLDMLAEMHEKTRDRERHARRVLMAGGTVETTSIYGAERAVSARAGKSDVLPSRHARTGARRRESHPRGRRTSTSRDDGASGSDGPGEAGLAVHRRRTGVVA